MAGRRTLKLQENDRFVRFCRAFFQRQGALLALQACQQHVAVLDQQLAAIAGYEGLPLDRTIDFDAAGRTISWEEAPPAPR